MNRFEVAPQEKLSLVERYFVRFRSDWFEIPPKELEVAGSIPAQGSSYYYYFYNTTISLSHASLSIDFLPKNSEFITQYCWWIRGVMATTRITWWEAMMIMTFFTDLTVYQKWRLRCRGRSWHLLQWARRWSQLWAHLSNWRHNILGEEQGQLLL